MRDEYYIKIFVRGKRLEPYFTEEMRHKFEIMYQGDKARDASDKVRGYLFQDLVAIEYLLEEQVQFVLLEYLEDVDVAYENGDFKIIQVKYYPKKSPNMKEISTDLYYQYLRFDLLNEELDKDNNVKINPQLVIHRDKRVYSPNYQKMVKYIGTVLPERPDSLTDIERKLKFENSKLKKEDQKKKVFLNWAYNDSLSNFLNEFKIIKKDNIQQLQSEIETKLVNKFPLCSMPGVQEYRGKILMGLAIIFIQERYKVEKSEFDDIRIDRVEFEQYIKNHTEIKIDLSIVAYISTIATEEYEAIILENSELSPDQILLLDLIYRNTIEWISEICNDVKGQFRIVNTLSSSTNEQVLEFLDCDVLKRLLKIAECKENLSVFFRYLWKIIFDICEMNRSFDLQKDGNLLRPQEYIVDSETRYICLHFPQDCVETSVILPPAYGAFKSKQKHHLLRLMNEKPRKWFMECDSKLAGKHEYDYSTAEIVENDSVIDMDRDSFIIECMQCIKIDENEWVKIDDCVKCIFAQSCVERKY